MPAFAMSSPISQNRLVYEALEPLDGPSARIRFSGRLQGREVIWQARLRTLEDVWRERLETQGLPPCTPMRLRQYIDIAADGDPAAWPLEVALAVPAIDAPTVFKTIIMIHNYKRLAPGRHEYGPEHPSPAS